jgi:hypothetical protein
MGMVKPDTFPFATVNQSTCVEIHSQNCECLCHIYTHTHTRSIYYILFWLLVFILMLLLPASVLLFEKPVISLFLVASSEYLNSSFDFCAVCATAVCRIIVPCYWKLVKTTINSDRLKLMKPPKILELCVHFQESKLSSIHLSVYSTVGQA